MRIPCLAALGASVLGSLTAAARVVDDDAASFRYSLANLADQPASADPAPGPAAAPAFGAAGSRWWGIGAGAAHDFDGSTDTDVNASFRYFLARDVEFGAEGALWNFNQPGDNAFGVSAVMIFRWHFYNEGKWSFYADAGIGLLGASNSVPDGGTSFDFMPRIGAGLTRQITEDGTRLEVGVRWHHVSNARIFGDSNNPARDAPMLYAGLIFPF